MKVFLRWVKEMHFGILDGSTPKDLINIARNRLEIERGLWEQEVKPYFEVENEKGEVIYTEKL